ncbi:MAG TPA: hypothetical protein VH599_09740 [Ktedonobacterales bacterium]|jgi:hypothetical protein
MMQKKLQQQTLTVGELCAAISEGRLPATLHDNEWYQVNGRELRRFVTGQPRTATSAEHIPRTIKG